MKLTYRLVYFSGGFTMGLLLVFFILSGKKTSCAYGAQSRTLKNIRLKDRAFSETSLHFFELNQLDTSMVSGMLIDGKVIFKESNTSLDSCKEYVIKGEISEKIVKLRIANCDDLATVLTADFDQ